MAASWNKKLTQMDIDRLFKEMKQELYYFIAKKVGNKGDIEDILQNVFLKIVEKSGSLEDTEKVRGWIYAITRNTIVDHYRKSKTDVYNNRLEGFDIGQEVRNALVFSDELNKCLNAAIDQLPEKYCEIIRLTEIEGIKQKDLAEQMNLAYPTLRSRVQRGKEKLTRIMQANCKYQMGYCEMLNRLDRNGCGICLSNLNEEGEKLDEKN